MKYLHNSNGACHKKASAITPIPKPIYSIIGKINVMSNEDLEELKQLQVKLYKAIDGLGQHPFFNSMSIPIDHAIEGVRVNGRGRKVGYQDIFREIPSLYKYYEKSVNGLPIIKAILDQMTSIQETYKPCQTCKGTQLYEGYECGNCNGDGFIKSISNHQGENPAK